MRKDDNKPDKKQTNNSPKEQDAGPLFSEKEVKSIVKDFIAAYISGQIKICFPTANSIMRTAQDTEIKKKMNYKKARSLELDIKTEITKLIGIASGTIESTPEEQKNAINELFSKILHLRNGQRIEGTFTEYALEDRIRRLEEGIDKVNNLVEEIVEWLMRGVIDK